jgi:hypothetical protein
LKIPKWILENLDNSLKILVKTKIGLGLNDVECRELKLTSLFSKLHKHGYIEGTFFIGFKYHNEGSKLTERGKELLIELEKKIENEIITQIEKRNEYEL